MKTFPAGYAAECAKKTGITPLWILKLTVGGVDYYLGDTPFAIPAWQGGVTVLPWVASWGQISEGITGELGEIRVADLSVEVIIDPDATIDMDTLASTPDIEQSPCSLYLWFAGLDPATDPPQEFGRFHVRDIAIPDETTVILDLEDETLRLRQQVGTRVDRTSYPDADPDDVGKVIPIVFGSIKRLPTLAVDAGLQTSLPSNISATSTSFALSDVAGWSIGKIFQLDAEQLYISAVSGDTVTVTRGYNATVPVVHLKGTIAWEIKNRFTYLVADHAVDQIPKVRGRVGQAEVDVTAVASRYLGSGSSALVGAGAVGGQHPDYPGRACVTLPGYITVEQAVDLLITDGLTVTDTIALPNGVRPYRRRDIRRQIMEHDSSAAAYIYARGSQLIQHEQAWRLSPTQRDALIAWLRDIAKGTRHAFTWVDHTGTPRLCKALTSQLDPQPLPSNHWQANLAMEERSNIG
jgi:hypothetical protein